VFPSIDFDGDSRLGPEEIEFVGADGHVGVRAGKFCVPKELEAASLRLRPGEVALVPFAENRPQEGHARSAGVSLGELRELLARDQAFPLPHRDCLLQFPTGEHPGDIGDRAGGCGDGDPIKVSTFILGQRLHPVEHDGWPPAPAAPRDRDVDRAWGINLRHLPEPQGTGVTQHGRRASKQNRAHLQGPIGLNGTDQIDAPVEVSKTSGRESTANRRGRHPELPELLSRHDPVLAGGRGADPFLKWIPGCRGVPVHDGDPIRRVTGCSKVLRRSSPSRGISMAQGVHSSIYYKAGLPSNRPRDPESFSCFQ
jgi:hypothetical protein